MITTSFGSRATLYIREPVVTHNVTINTTGATINGANTVNDGETYTATFTASQDYRLPVSITVQMNGTALTSSDYTWNSSTGVLTVPNVTGDLSIAVSGESLTRNVTFNLTNVTTNGTNTATEGNSYSCTFTANSNYKLPSTITVTMGGTTLDIGQNQYTYNSQTGAFSISNVTGDIEITVTGEYTIKNVTFNLSHVTTNGVNTATEGNSYSCAFTPATNYELPEEITVTMGETTLDAGLNQYTWNNQTGAFSISNVTGNISISINASRGSGYATANEFTLGTGVSLVPYSSLTGDMKQAVDDGKVIAVLSETIDGTPTTAVIPTGFEVSSTTGENKISGGLVVEDSTGNEFVWIPVQNISDMAVLQTGSSTDYRGVLYNWNTDSTGQTEYSWSASSTDFREPANLTGTVTDQSFIYDSQDAFTTYGGGTYTNTMYQTEFNSMVESVGKYKGFYVGRYETGGFNGSTIVVKAGETGTEDSSSANNSINNATWYKMYQMQKDFASTNTNVASTMIWGCQYDQVMKFVDDKSDGAGNTFDVTTLRSERHTNSLAATGNNINDKVQNIYDLEGNVHEWTLEAYSTIYRVIRGGCYDFRNFAAYRFLNSPDNLSGSLRKPCHTLYKVTLNAVDQGTDFWSKKANY